MSGIFEWLLTILLRVLPSAAAYPARWKLPLQIKIENRQEPDPLGYRRRSVVVRVVNPRDRQVRIETVTLQLSNNRYLVQGAQRSMRTQRRGTPVVIFQSETPMGVPEIPKTLGTNEPVEAFFNVGEIKEALQDRDGEISGFVDQAAIVDSRDFTRLEEVSTKLNTYVGLGKQAEAARERREKLRHETRVAHRIILISTALALLAGAIWVIVLGPEEALRRISNPGITDDWKRERPNLPT